MRRSGARPAGPARRPDRRSPVPGHRHAIAAGLVLLLVLLVVRATLVVPVRVSSASMLPTFEAGDVILVSRLAPDVEELARGDLVVFRDPAGGRTLKRVVGLPGERVAILDGVLHVDGEPQEEAWVTDPLDGYFTRALTAGEGEVVVLGDNRGNSIDSRDYGPVTEEDLLGRVLVRLWPPGPGTGS